MKLTLSLDPELLGHRRPLVRAPASPDLSAQEAFQAARSEFPGWRFGLDGPNVWWAVQGDRRLEAPTMPVLLALLRVAEAQDQAMAALRAELAAYGIVTEDRDVHRSARGVPLLSLARGLLVYAGPEDWFRWVNERTRWRWHPLRDAPGAARLLAPVVWLRQEAGA